MEEQKFNTPPAEEDMYDSADRPFDFVGADEQTAIICEGDEEIRKNACAILESMDFQITDVSSTKDALKNMRYHEYDVIIVNDNLTNEDGENDVLDYLNKLSMSIRRKMFVVLVSDTYRTMDNMTAFNKSVNLILNTQNFAELETILNRGIAINEVFYNVFKEAQRRSGRV